MCQLSDLIDCGLSDSTEKSIEEYAWVGASGMLLRSKERTLSGPVSDASKLYDGLCAGQAPGEDSKVILPQATFKEPIGKGKIILVFECNASAEDAILTKMRHSFALLFSDPDVVDEEPSYGIEQEYTPIVRFHGPQEPCYCGVGADKAFGCDIIDFHHKPCLYAGVNNISGINREVMPGQLEFQVGPSVVLSAGDARYILEGDCNGVGAHINFSTKSTRYYGGSEVREKEMEKLQRRHKDHIAANGEGNKHCLTMRHETADINTCSSGVADAPSARDIEEAGKGYFKDWRPKSIPSPLVVTGLFCFYMFFNRTEITGSRWTLKSKTEITGSRGTLKFAWANCFSRTWSFERIEWKRCEHGSRRCNLA